MAYVNIEDNPRNDPYFKNLATTQFIRQQMDMMAGEFDQWIDNARTTTNYARQNSTEKASTNSNAAGTFAEVGQ